MSGRTLLLFLALGGCAAVPVAPDGPAGASAAGDPRAEIGALEERIAAVRAAQGLPAAATPDETARLGARSTREQAAPPEAPPPQEAPRCPGVCRAAEDICRYGERICRLAQEIDDGPSQQSCARARAECADARRRCKGCS